jgi:hypothetical protein
MVQFQKPRKFYPELYRRYHFAGVVDDSVLGLPPHTTTSGMPDAASYGRGLGMSVNMGTSTSRFDYPSSGTDSKSVASTTGKTREGTANEATSKTSRDGTGAMPTMPQQTKSGVLGEHDPVHTTKMGSGSGAAVGVGGFPSSIGRSRQPFNAYDASGHLGLTPGFPHPHSQAFSQLSLGTEPEAPSQASQSYAQGLFDPSLPYDASFDPSRLSYDSYLSQDLSNPGGRLGMGVGMGMGGVSGMTFDSQSQGGVHVGNVETRTFQR